MIRSRPKLLRKPKGYGYPIYVCERCGTYGAEDSNTEMQEHIEYQLQRCGICGQLTQVAPPRDFGLPTFYTYLNGAPVT